MREILFRGKRTDNGEWCYGHLYKNYFGDWVIVNEKSRLIVNDKTIGQYTGLKDKNGKKIFEHDLLKDEFGFIHEVYFDDGCFMRKCGLRSSSLATTHCALVVVGNIFDNQELLNQ